MRVYLADLGHNQLTLSSDVYPLGIANLAMYLEAYLNGHCPVETRLFREPEDLKKALDTAPPDILGLSSYAWNHNLSIAFADYAKKVSPGTLTLMGGPNYPLTRAEQESYMRTLPQVDVATRGPTYEGERAILELVKRFIEVDGSIEAFKEEPVPANHWIDPKSGELIVGEEVPRITDLDEIPSPYLSGLLDPYFETGYFPLMQITRGCPFTCTFCNSAVASNNKAFRHSVENIQKDMTYIAEHVKPETPLCLADDNFGMYPWDEEVGDFIGHLQDKYDWPRYIRTTTGKNRGERIIKVMRKARGALPMTAAVQSLNPVALKAIKRDNISLDTYAEVQKEVLAQGMQSYGELILCLPGETRESFYQAVDDLLDTGVKRVSAHQLMLLYGAPLANPESRAEHGFETRFRVVARNISDTLGERIIETEEIVVATPTFTFDDYLESRVFHLLLTIFHYEGNFEELFKLAAHHGIKPGRMIRILQRQLDQSPPGFREVIDEFVRESREELFDTVEECEQWGHDHFEELVSGEAGGNLLSKYSMLGRFFTTKEAIEFLRRAIAAHAEESDSDAFATQASSVTGYLRAVCLQSPFSESLAATPEWETLYDVPRWREDGYTDDLTSYAFEAPRLFHTEVPEKVRRLITERIETFGDNPAGLGKFTRTMFAQDLRRATVPAD